MKREEFLKIVLLPVLFFHLLNLSAQVPYGFNFQGVARNSGGELLANTQVMLKIGVIAATGSITVWEETHSVTTNETGLFKLVIGRGTRTAGTVSQFSMINWGINNYSLKVQLDAGNGYENMGSTEIQSVPYALTAGSVSSLSALSSLDVVEIGGHDVDSALFSVKNIDGNIVFAVYNEGVRINVADYPGVIKGKKGGFAIGGFGAGKGETNEYMRVTPDSVRVYVDETISKGKKGGFAIGGFGAGKGVTDFLHLTSDNYFIGHQAGDAITTGLYNSFFGYDAGLSNTIGSNNVFIGNETGNSNVDGHWNIFIGNRAGFANTSGQGNIILGDEAGRSNTTGSGNVFLGDWAGRDNTIGKSNVYIGADAGLSNLGGSYNVFLGSASGYSNEDGISNVFLGESSGNKNISGSYNVFLGELSGFSNIGGISNVFLGKEAGTANTSGSYNVFLGTLTGQENTIGQQNVFLGQEAGSANMTGNFNVAIGTLSGSSNISGSSNVFIGYQAGIDEEGSNRLYIDNKGLSWDETLIYGEFDNDYLGFYANVEVAGDIYGASLNETSDKKFKTNIVDVPSILNKVMALRPVTYDWNTALYPKSKFSHGKQIGLIAQEVETLFPELVKINKKGDMAISYTKLSVLLIEAMKEQQEIIENLKEENDVQKEKLQQLSLKVDTLIETLRKQD